MGGGIFTGMFSLLYYQLIRSQKRHERTIHGRKSNSSSNEMKKDQATENDKQVGKKMKRCRLCNFKCFSTKKLEKHQHTKTKTLTLAHKKVKVSVRIYYKNFLSKFCVAAATCGSLKKLGKCSIWRITKRLEHFACKYSQMQFFWIFDSQR